MSPSTPANAISANTFFYQSEPTTPLKKSASFQMADAPVSFNGSQLSEPSMTAPQQFTSTTLPNSPSASFASQFGQRNNVNLANSYPQLSGIPPNTPQQHVNPSQPSFQPARRPSEPLVSYTPDQLASASGSVSRAESFSEPNSYANQTTPNPAAGDPANAQNDWMASQAAAQSKRRRQYAEQPAVASSQGIVSFDVFISASTHVV